MRRLNVLVLPGGTEIGHEVAAALRFSKEVRLFSAGMDVSSHAPYIFSRHRILPHVKDPQWLPRLNAIVADWAIDYIYPGHDDVLTELARRRKDINTRSVISPLQTCVIARSKSATYDHLSAVVPVPRRFARPDLVDAFPVFVKPDASQGSQGAHLVLDSDRLHQIVSERPDSIMMEYLPGKEYTIDCFSDRDVGLLYCSGRQRVRTRAGISMNTKSVSCEQFSTFASAISSCLSFHGAWFFQVREDANGTLKLLEVAPRIGGAMAYDRARGVNLPLLSLYEQERVPVKIRANDFDLELDRALVNRYSHNVGYHTVYVDLDDTLIIDDLVNTILMRFLFQCVNRGIRIVLLTRHDGDLKGKLERHRLAGIFDQIIRVPPLTSKAAYVDCGEAVFIDDSFSEREAVRELCGIATFDCSMLEVLIDDRT